MGEAKRRKEAAEAALARVNDIDPEQAAQAVRQVVGAISEAHAADCMLYANVGAHLLRFLGIDVKVVAGSASWRVGSGDGDTISHAH